MKDNWFKRNYETIIRVSYIIPILIAAGISVYHVISWYGMTNPMAWAIYLSVGIEVAALSALAGMTAKMNNWVYLPFVIVTFVQLLGNIFASYHFIDINSVLFTSWVELFSPIFEYFNWVENGNLMQHKRILGFLGGIFIPIISLSFLHLLISFNEKRVDSDTEKVEKPEDDKPLSGNSEPVSGNFPNKEVKRTYTVPVGDKTKEEEYILPVGTLTGDTKEEEMTEQVTEQELELEIVKPEEPLPQPKREPVIPQGHIKREDIKEIKDGENRGFSQKIPKPNNTIERIGSNKVVKNNDKKKIYFKRDKDK